MKYDSIPVTAKLSTLLEDKAKLKVRAELSRNEVTRLTKLLNPQYQQETVRIVHDIRHEDIHKRGVVSSGTDEIGDDARRDDELQRTLAGEPILESTNVQSQLELASRQWTAIETAIAHVNKEIAKERTSIAIEYSKRLAPMHKDIMTRLAKPLVELHAVYLEAYELKRHLIDNDLGLRGLCLTLPEHFLSTPNNTNSDFADYFRALKSEGYIKEVPKALQIKGTI